MHLNYHYYYHQHHHHHCHHYIVLIYVIGCCVITNRFRASGSCFSIVSGSKFRENVLKQMLFQNDIHVSHKFKNEGRKDIWAFQELQKKKKIGGRQARKFGMARTQQHFTRNWGLKLGVGEKRYKIDLGTVTQVLECQDTWRSLHYSPHQCYTI